MDGEFIEAECIESVGGNGSDVETEEYPLRTDHLNKGDRVLISELEQAFGVHHGTDAFRFKMMSAQRYIEQRFADRGEAVTTRTDDKIGILILNDEEALAYNAKRFEIETRQRNRCYLRLSQIDRGQLSDVSKSTIDRKIVELGARVQTDRKVRREMTLKPVERKTPLLVKNG